MEEGRRGGRRAESGGPIHPTTGQGGRHTHPPGGSTLIPSPYWNRYTGDLGIGVWTLLSDDGGGGCGTHALVDPIPGSRRQSRKRRNRRDKGGTGAVQRCPPSVRRALPLARRLRGPCRATLGGGLRQTQCPHPASTRVGFGRTSGPPSPLSRCPSSGTPSPPVSNLTDPNPVPPGDRWDLTNPSRPPP